MKSWSFIFAASRTSDYRFVMQPDIFDEATCAEFSRRLELDDGGSDRTRVVEFPSKDGDNLLGFYVSGPTTIDGKELLDAAGRKLLSAFGFIFAGAGENMMAEAAAAIRSNRPIFEAELRAFISHEGRWEPRLIQPRDHPARQKKPARPFGWLGPVGLLSVGLLALLLLSIDLYRENLSHAAKLREVEAQLAKLAASCGAPKKEMGESSADKPPPTTGSNLEQHGPITSSK